MPSTRSINIMMEAYRRHYVTSMINNNSDNSDSDNSDSDNSDSSSTNNSKIDHINNAKENENDKHATSSSSSIATALSIDHPIYRYYQLFNKYYPHIQPDSFTYSTLVRAAQNSSQVKQALKLSKHHFNPPLLRCAIVSMSYIININIMYFTYLLVILLHYIISYIWIFLL